MKKQTHKTLPTQSALCTLLLCIVLSCCGCGADTKTPSVSGTEDAPADEGENAGNDASNQEPDSPENDMDDNTAAESGDSAPSETDTSVTTGKSNIQIELKEEIDCRTADDGTEYLTKSCTYPVVTIEGNNAAAEKINADIQNRIDSYRADTELETQARGAYEDFAGEDTYYSFLPYSQDLTFDVKRADSNVISFTETSYAFTGGAHGNSAVNGINYNAKTGDLIAFSELSDDSAAFREDTLAYNQKLAESESYRNRMFSEEDITNGTLESVLYADNVWYLSTSGLVFMSQPYALGPYAAGTIEFIIPYGDLADMGFRDSYAYSDRFVLKLQDNAEYSHDLNGDGQEDSLRIYTDYMTDDNEAFSGTVFRPIINGTDFAADNKLLEGLPENTNWAEFTLFDLDPADSYTEIVFYVGQEEENDYVYYSHFYRYDKDGSFTYLGKTKGDINNPLTPVTDLSS